MVKLIWENTLIPNNKTEEDVIAAILTAEDRYIEQLYRDLLNSKHKIYIFENGYGVSVIKGPGTKGFKQGFWEIALIKDIIQVNKDFPQFDLVAEPFMEKEEKIDILLENMSNVTSSLDFDPDYISEDMFY